MAVLEIPRPEGSQRFPLTLDRVVLGRHPECDLVLDAGAVSRQHAQITRINNDFYLEDLKSRNGTFINDQQITAPTRLQNGDRVKICDLTLDFFSEDGAPTRTHVPDETDLLATFIDDGGKATNTIMSKLDISAGSHGMRLSVHPEAKLRALMEITQNLGASLELDVVLPKILDSLFKIFVQADRGFVVLKQEPEGRLVPKAVKHRRSGDDESIRLSRTIVEQVINGKQAILSADATSDSRFEMSQSIADFRIRSMMCAPLLSADGEALGMIQIDALDQRGRFQAEDLEVLASVASQAAFAVDNAQLHQRQLRQRQIERDLELAHKVQQGLLPSMPPKVPNYHFFDFYDAASEVGGDFYDYIALPGGRMAVVLADVSGKGVSAALVMAKLSAEVRFCLASTTTAAEAVRQINTNFCAAGWEDRFVTMIVCLLEPATGELSIVNAGHMAPLMRHASGQVEAVGEEQSGLPLGVCDGYEYEESRFPMKPGDAISLFTDGFSEAMNAKNELYGLARLQKTIGEAGAVHDRLGATILQDVRAFVGGRAQSDDMCLVCFGRNT